MPLFLIFIVFNNHTHSTVFFCKTIYFHLQFLFSVKELWVCQFRETYLCSTWEANVVNVFNLNVNTPPFIFLGLIAQPLSRSALYCTRVYRSLESLIMMGQKSFLNQFDEIPRRSLIVCFLSLLPRAGLNLPPFEISCLWPPSQEKKNLPTPWTKRSAAF